MTRQFEFRLAGMSTAFDVLISFMVYIYLLVAGFNFVQPVNRNMSILILFLSSGLSVYRGTRLQFEIFSFAAGERFNLTRHRILLLSCVGILVLGWGVVISIRPTLDSDANVYRLPLSLLMNQSIWYPGISNLSHHFGFANGSAAISSVFTAFGIVGFENIPNFIFWVIFGIGTFLYFAKVGLSGHAGFLFVCMALFTPVVFWQSYNMGSDLPHICFLFLGLSALWLGDVHDAVGFFAVAAVMKSLGFIAYFTVVIYLLICLRHVRPFSRDVQRIWFISGLLLLALTSRVYVATGNPIYPLYPITLSEWGIPATTQKSRINILRRYTRVERTLSGTLRFAKNLILFPKKARSSFWFSPAFVGYGVMGILLVLYKPKRKYGESPETGKGGTLSLSAKGFSIFLTMLLFSIWFYGSPVFRFAGGLFLFITAQSYIFVFRHVTRFSGSDRRGKALWSCLVYGPVVFCCIVFGYNAMTHIRKDIVSYFTRPDTRRDMLPYDPKIFSVVRSEDGFLYTRSVSNYSAGRGWPLPGISNYSTGNAYQLVSEYRKHNGLN